MEKYFRRLYLLILSLQYVFNNGQMDIGRLKDLVQIVGKERLVLDLSCRKKVLTFIFDGKFIQEKWNFGNYWLKVFKYSRANYT